MLRAVSVGIWPLLSCLFCCNNTRDIIEHEGVLIAKCKFWYCLAVGVLVFNDLKSMVSRVRAIRPSGSGSSAPAFGAINDPRCPRLLGRCRDVFFHSRGPHPPNVVQ